MEPHELQDTITVRVVVNASTALIYVCGNILETIDVCEMRFCAKGWVCAKKSLMILLILSGKPHYLSFSGLATCTLCQARKLCVCRCIVLGTLVPVAMLWGLLPREASNYSSLWVRCSTHNCAMSRSQQGVYIHVDGDVTRLLFVEISLPG